MFSPCYWLFTYSVRLKTQLRNSP
jgi:cell shape-determining protein MreC